MSLEKKNRTESFLFSNRQLILPYTAPYFAYVLIASVGSSFLPASLSYLFRIIISAGLLMWAWKWYMDIKGPNSLFSSLLLGAAAGFFGFGLWIAALTPFVNQINNEPWSLTAFLLRIFAAGCIVPVFEEIVMRGFIFRLIYQWDTNRKKGSKEPLLDALDNNSVNNVAPGAWSWPAVLLSSFIFASGHQFYEWPAAILYGLLMSWLWIVSKNLISCIAAHAVTNITLAFFVFFTGYWQFW